MSFDSLENIKDLFLEEMEELLVQAEEGLLLLESDLKNQEVIDQLFRCYHTIKGGAGMSGLLPLSEYTHHVENFLDAVRSGKLDVSSEVIPVLFESFDCLKSYLEDALGHNALNHVLIQENLLRIQAFFKKQDISQTIPQPVLEPFLPESSVQHLEDVEKVFAEPEEPEVIFFIQLKFSPDFFQDKTDPIMLIRDLQSLGTLHIIPHPHDVPGLEEICTHTLYLWWSLLLRTHHPQGKIEDILMFFMEGHRVYINIVSDVPEVPERQEESDVSVVVDPPLSREVLPPLPSEKFREPPKEPPVSSEVIPSSSKEPVSSAVPRKKPEGESVTIRVAISKLDQLINLVGEVVIFQARMRQVQEEVSILDENTGERLQYALEDYDRVVNALRDQAMRVRMVPISGTIQPFRRLVRDYARQSGKKINLVLNGEETEIDKIISEKLSGPLKHLVRNAMDHGLEPSEVRHRLGKDPTGTITISASHKQGAVFVEIQDDGAGIDCERVLEKARAKGLVGESDVLTEENIYQLLFKPGFSTSEQVTDISGRGVGMDVVRQEIEAMRGVVMVESCLGQGSLFRIKLPLTLAIIPGMLVKVADRIFTIPLLSIVESLRIGSDQLRTLKGRGEIVTVSQDHIPLLRLYKAFNLDSAQIDPSKGLIIVVEDSGNKCCLLVDDIIDEQQVVIKSLEDNFMSVEGISGAMIMKDGMISLILDVPGLLRKTLTV